MANSKNFNFLNKIVKNLNKDTEKPIDIDNISSQWKNTLKTLI